jgi:predicted transcriptional regulator of viral defense system
VKQGALYRIRKGIYAKDQQYDPFELATKIYTPSYISFETVLLQEGVAFQYYETIFAASYLSREIRVDGRNYRYRRLREDILLNSAGVIQKNNYSIASKERAFLDMVYLMGSMHFDHLDQMNWDQCFEIAKIYKTKTIIRLLNSYYQDFKDARP